MVFSRGQPHRYSLAGCPAHLSFIKEYVLFTKYQIREIPISSPDYPKEWLALKDAPEKLYAVGDISLLKERKVVIVGSRRTAPPALQIGSQIAKDLSHSVAIVTGTADGGDSAVIEGALAGRGRVICLLAGGFGSVPQFNLNLLQKVEKQGLILSPHPYDTPVRNFSYDYRNKLLAALGEGTLVIGAAEKSGALITARHAWSMKKQVFALPYFPGHEAGVGCNAILRGGGILTESAFDVAAKLAINLEERKLSEVKLTVDEGKLMTTLRSMTEGHIMDLASMSGFPAYKVKALLSALEVKGAVVALGGNRYTPAKK